MSSEPSLPLRFPVPIRPRWLTLRRPRPRWNRLLPQRPPLPPMLRLLPPLPCTTAAVLVLVLVPALLLSRWSRPRAEGLDQLMGASSLLQSFAPNPDRPIPELWRERLGAELAQQLWQRQGRPWWQFWAIHSESAPFLAIPAESLASPPAALAARILRVGDLWVVAESPIAQRQLRASLRPLQRRSQGFGRRCLERLKTSQAVFWNPQAMVSIVGPLAPLLDRFQSGCLSLAVEPQAVRWQGEASALASVASGLNQAGSPPLGRGPQPAPPPAAMPFLPAFDPAVAALPVQPPLAKDLLLELRGASLDLLLEGLLAREMIRDPLASRYGLDAPRLAEVRRAPFRLRLRPQPQGPFQASLELQLDPGSARASWLAVLQAIQKALVAQGFTPVAGTPLGAPPAAGSAGSSGAAAAPGTPQQAPSPTPSGATLSATTPSGTTPSTAAPANGTAPVALPNVDQPTLWRRMDGTLVGGWRWITSGAAGGPQLLLFLGPPPLSPLPMSRDPRQQPAAGALWLRLQPRQLADLGMLPAEMPALLRRADQLWMDAESSGIAGPSSGSGAVQPLSPVSLLKGRLQVRR